MRINLDFFFANFTSFMPVYRLWIDLKNKLIFFKLFVINIYLFFYGIHQTIMGGDEKMIGGASSKNNDTYYISQNVKSQTSVWPLLVYFYRFLIVKH